MTSAHKTKKSTEPKFEEAMAELEEVVRRVETGDTPLEESLQAFERGVALVRSLHARLDAVQSRIEELSRGSEGALGVAGLAGGTDDEGGDAER
ncbi:MAG: exodeoxyribonuclease VII small subunit [Deltaproteobacteria bacterium]|nr:exodeoxyribonuclease VII small subunit [Deltaproteobacteria bacterium]